LAQILVSFITASAMTFVPHSKLHPFVLKRSGRTILQFAATGTIKKNHSEAGLKVIPED
jgi:hypothetical protein